jgi:hypothetical protein
VADQERSKSEVILLELEAEIWRPILAAIVAVSRAHDTVIVKRGQTHSGHGCIAFHANTLTSCRSVLVFDTVAGPGRDNRMRPAVGGGESERGGRPRVWRVFLTCWLVCTFFWTPYIVREHFPALTLAERGSLNVERYLGWIDDIFRGPKDGAYINNNPGASLTGAIPLILLRPLLTRVDQWNQQLPRPGQRGNSGELFRRTVDEGRAYYFLLAAFLTVALVMAPATAGTAAYMCIRLGAAGVPAAHAAWVALLYSLGTPVLFRTGHLNHNLLVGDAGITALLLLWDPDDRPLGTGRAAVAGLLAGYAVLCDYSGVVVMMVTLLYSWMRSAGQARAQRLWTMAAFAAGCIPGIAALALYQAWAFGSFYHPSQHYMVPTAPTARGYRGFDWPSPTLMWANFVDPRFGLFAWCPALLLGFAAPFVAGIRYRIPPRETGVLLTYFALFVLFCSANQYSWLQPSTGFRYLVPVVPPLALLSMQTAQILPALVRRVVTVLACAQSLILAASHENDIRAALGVLVQRRFELFWMIRLRDAGAPVTWVWAVGAWVLLILAVTLVWLVPCGRSGRNES